MTCTVTALLLDASRVMDEAGPFSTTGETSDYIQLPRNG
jgi:hypothetical protein